MGGRGTVDSFPNIVKVSFFAFEGYLSCEKLHGFQAVGVDVEISYHCLSRKVWA